MGGGLRRGWQARLLAVVALVAAADGLFFGVGIGCNAAVYGGLLLGAILVFGAGRARRPAVRLLVALELGLLLALLEEPGGLALIMSVSGLGMIALAMRHGGTWDVWLWIWRGVTGVARGCVQWAHDLRTSAAACERGERPRFRLRGLRRWIPAIGLGLVFLILFSAANPLLRRWVRDVAGHVFDLGRYLDAGRLFFWVVIAAVTWAFLRVRAPREPHLEGQAPDPQPLVSSGTIARSLLVFNALFLLQNGLDLHHLWMGATLPDGMTYAEYAHRGAYPLIASALLAAVFVLLTFRAGLNASTMRWCRKLVYLFLLQNVFLTTSAMLRLANYVEAYSVTRLRVAAFLWMGLVAIGLLWILLRILLRRTNAWLLSVNAATAMLLLYACCFPNFDRYIADYNVQHCAELGGGGPPIDVEYLKQLGPDALPAFVRLKAEAPTETLQFQAQKAIEYRRARLDEDLGDWRTWTLRRRRLAQFAEGP